MGFSIVTDSSCNLPVSLIKQYDLKIISLVFQMNGQQTHSYLKGQDLDLKPLYTALRNKETVTTSSVAPQDCIDIFRAEFEAGNDVLYVGFSSGLSATYQTAATILSQLAEEYPQRRAMSVDTLAAVLCEGLLAIKAAEMRDAGKTIEETHAWILTNRLNFCHWLTVDDLFFLHRGGRVSKTAAVVGSIVGIKPVLHVDADGCLTLDTKIRGRRAALGLLIDRLESTAIDLSGQTIGISHGDCEEDAIYLRDEIEKRLGVKQFIITCLEPVLASHAGPGTIVICFVGSQR